MGNGIRYFIILFCCIAFQQAFGQDIFIATRDGNLKRMKELIKQKPDTVNAVNELGFNPLMIACYRGGNKAAKLLVASGAKVNARSPEGNALLAASYQDNHKLAAFLIKSGAELNAPGPDGSTALMYAVLNQNPKLVKILTAAGADLKAKNNAGQTAYILAMSRGNVKIREMVKAK